MLKIALCDDEAEQRAVTGELLQEYIKGRPALSARLSIFSSGREVLSAVEDSGGFDIYVLDIVMPELSGIELGGRLRELGSEGAIIYLTISPEYAVDSYAVQAFHYLMKPVAPEKLYHVLDQAVSAREKRKSSCITVKTKDGLSLVRLDELLYAELSSRTVRYHLAGGTRIDSITIRHPFQDEIAPLLADSRFFQCGASFVVNLFYVTAVEKSVLRIDGGKRVPLPRGLAAQARLRWGGYWLGQAGEEL